MNMLSRHNRYYGYFFYFSGANPADRVLPHVN